MAERAFITPEVLKWARKTAKMSEEKPASKAAVPVEKLRNWEKGKSQPTIRQAQILAKTYKRPLALFFLPEIPNDFKPLQDFRKKGSKDLGTASIFIIREIQQKQAWISELNKKNEEPKAAFVGRLSTKEKPEIVAKDILNTLKINPLDYETENPIKEWIEKSESKGIFISRTSFIHSKLTLDSEEIQGFAIADPYAPFIFVNSSDWNAPQLFTLVHELTHIWFAESGISNEIYPIVEERNKYHPIELFCNEVAANALIPKDFLTNLSEDAFKSTEKISKISKLLGVSSYAFIVRAHNLNLISNREYKKLKQKIDLGFQEFLRKDLERRTKRKEIKGGPNPYLLRLNKNGRLFTQVVLDAYNGGFVEPNVASDLLNTPINKFSKLEAQLYK